MTPKIKMNVGRGRAPVEVQLTTDNNLMTKNKMVVGAINELYYELRQSEEAKPSVFNAPTHKDFPAVGDSNVIYKAETERMLYQWNSVKMAYETLFCGNV